MELLSLAEPCPHAALPGVALPECPHYQHSEFTGVLAASGSIQGKGTDWVPPLPGGWALGSGSCPGHLWICPPPRVSGGGGCIGWASEQLVSQVLAVALVSR